MEMYLQCGHGMINHCRELITRWKGGTVILSPRDNTKVQLRALTDNIHAIPGGDVLLDPQFYVPHTEREKLVAHDYWPADFDSLTFTQGPGLAKLMMSLLKYNNELGCREFIIPGLYAASVDDDWLRFQHIFVETAKMISGQLPVCPTIALSSDAVKDDDQIELLLEHARGWKAEHYYIVLEHPPLQYIVDDPGWVSNALDLCAGLKLLGARVLLGYCNQQMLIAAIAKVYAIASGTWMNVRSFNPQKFEEDEGNIKRKAIWYYCPHALDEYKALSLDTAKKLGLLSYLAPQPSVNGGDVDGVFQGYAPSAILTEPLAFRHFLHALRAQAAVSSKPSFDETCKYHDDLLAHAEQQMKAFAVQGISGEMRDFASGVSANRQALAILKHTRGPVLRRNW